MAPRPTTDPLHGGGARGGESKCNVLTRFDAFVLIVTDTGQPTHGHTNGYDGLGLGLNRYVKICTCAIDRIRSTHAQEVPTSMHSSTRRRHENEHFKRFSLTHSLLCHLLLLCQFDVRCQRRSASKSSKSRLHMRSASPLLRQRERSSARLWSKPDTNEATISSSPKRECSAILM